MSIVSLYRRIGRTYLLRRWHSIVVDNEVYDTLKCRISGVSVKICFNDLLRQILDLPAVEKRTKKKYHLENLNVDQSVMIPFEYDLEKNKHGFPVNGDAILQAIRRASKRFAMEFRSEYAGKHMKVTRVR